jgi:undecaprenyl-diphosphatase
MLFEINRNLLIFFNNLSNYKIIEKLVLIFSDTPIFFIPIFLIYIWIYYTYSLKEDNKKKSVLFIFYSTIISIIIALIIQNIIHIERPENYINKTGKLILNHLPDASFPSDHATVSFAFLTSLFLF